VGRLSRIPWKRASRCLAISAGVLAVGAGLFALSGIYNVAASVPHFAVTERLVGIALRRSVALHSAGIPPPDLTDPGRIRLGAHHFRNGCAPCHGSPDFTPNPVVRQMYPAAPPLSTAVARWDDAELFWIVKHGIKMTGMPAWPGRDRDAEVWAVTAFLRALPTMEPDEYVALVGADDGSAIPATDPGGGRRTGAELTRACAACHGDGDTPPVSPIVPALNGQKAAYLARALAEYRSDRRQSGMMEAVAAALGSDDAMAELALAYAGRAPLPSDWAADPESVRRGRAIAEDGVGGDELPACRACHSREANGNFPLLDGLSQTYLATQLELFRSGARDETAYGAIMSAIAPRLTAQQIEDVTTYFASRSLDDGAAAVEAAP
jgi:cytochrome c553